MNICEAIVYLVGMAWLGYLAAHVVNASVFI